MYNASTYYNLARNQNVVTLTVIRRKELDPSSHSLAEARPRKNKSQAGKICEDAVFCCSQHVKSPGSTGMHDRQHLSLMDRVVSFGGFKLSRI